MPKKDVYIFCQKRDVFILYPKSYVLTLWLKMGMSGYCSEIRGEFPVLELCGERSHPFSVISPMSTPTYSGCMYLANIYACLIGIFKKLSISDRNT